MLATTVEFVFRILVHFLGLVATMDGVTVAESETVISDEVLTEATRKYPIIYNKNTKGYKDTREKENGKRLSRSVVYRTLLKEYDCLKT